jgi:hypothetical protein
METGKLFRYMIIDYDFDKMIEFGVETAGQAKEVAGPQYSKLSQKDKKAERKINRLKAQFLPLIEQLVDGRLWTAYP